MRTIIVTGPQYHIDMFDDGSLTIYHIGHEALHCLGSGAIKDGRIVGLVTASESVLDKDTIARIENALRGDEGVVSK